ncbi:hypothetical protein E2P81_ATG05454 [Venturia nashicola]|nr:hypothetical protein E2P81_ATG05454 [Venturia nashicola]
MLFQSTFFLTSAISVSALANAELCLQGCCGLAFKLPSTSLKLHHLTLESSSIQVPLKTAEIRCCPCDDTPVPDQATLQPSNSHDNEAICSTRLPCSNGNASTPILPINSPSHGAPRNGPQAGPPAIPTVWGIACPENQCDPSWCDCDTSRSIVDFATPAAKSEGRSAIGKPCPENLCRSDCDCDTNFVSSPKGSNESMLRKAMPVCPEGECLSDCECSVDSMVALLNPGTSPAFMRRICAAGECSADCICRDDLASAARVAAVLREHNSSFASKKDGDQKILAGKSEL